MKFLYFYENFFRFTKKFLPILTLQGFFKIFLPQPRVWCFQLIFIIQYAVRKIISHVCSLFMIQKVYTSWTSMFSNVNDYNSRDTSPSSTKKACRFITKRDSKKFLEITERIEHLQQNALVKLRFSDFDPGQV